MARSGGEFVGEGARERVQHWPVTEKKARKTR